MPERAPLADAPELDTEVLIIGAGVTGTGVMRDLALRGIHCILIDRRDLNAGASGGNHGLLHSGGRYAASDTATAAECRIEGDILKRIAADAVDDCGGLFAAVEGDDATFIDAFPGHCAAAGIACEALPVAEARALEPALSERLVAAYRVPDASIDPFRLTLASVQQARLSSDSLYRPHLALTRFDIADDSIIAAHCVDRRSGNTVRIRARQFVNAAGAWSAIVAQRAGCDNVRLLYSKGTLLISNSRISERVINRLRPPADGDILVPGGTVSLLGTTSATVTDPDDIHPTVAEVDVLVTQGAALLPALQHTRFIRAFSGVRPLLVDADAGTDGRQASRGFTLFDHTAEGLANFATIAGGKLTTFRLMAEKTGDLVAARLGNSNPSHSTTIALPASDGVRWTEPGYAARHWFQRQDPTDLVLCECEMVPQSTVDAILHHAPGAESDMTVRAIGTRSRIGKGTCQGAFCSQRVTAELYDRDVYRDERGLQHVRDFIEERYKGVRPVLWGGQLPQFELAESLHCGLMGLDVLPREPSETEDATTPVSTSSAASTSTPSAKS